jgi:ADP-ribosylglycohydrolase
LAQQFVTVFKRDPREGYAQGFYHFLIDIEDGTDFLARIKPGSDKSGAAMRASPIGVFGTVATVLDKCRVQAAITHNTPDGIHAAQAAALMSHYFLYDLGRKSELGRFLEAHVPGQWSVPWTGKVREQGWMSVRAAITAVIASSSMSHLLTRCIDYTGDVDTVAAIALAAASASREVEQDLPPALYAGLEDGAFGRNYLEELDHKLLAARG